MGAALTRRTGRQADKKAGWQAGKIGERKRKKKKEKERKKKKERKKEERKGKKERKKGRRKGKERRKEERKRKKEREKEKKGRKEGRKKERQKEADDVNPLGLVSWRVVPDSKSPHQSLVGGRGGGGGGWGWEWEETFWGILESSLPALVIITKPQRYRALPTCQVLC